MWGVQRGWVVAGGAQGTPPPPVQDSITGTCDRLRWKLLELGGGGIWGL